MNKVILIGRLTKDPELKFAAGSGMAVCSFSIAVDRRTSKDGKKEADFINTIAFGKTAETIANYLSKGRMIAISGRIQTGSYDAKDGTKRYTTDVVIDEFQFIDSGNKKPETSGSSNFGSSVDNSFNTDSYSSNMTPMDDGDIPF